MAERMRKAKAMIAPETVYASPKDVLGDAAVTDGDKLTILLRWAHNIRKFAAVNGGGMTGEHHALLRRIQLALDGLSVILDMNRATPTQQGDLNRPAAYPAKNLD